MTQNSTCTGESERENSKFPRRGSAWHRARVVRPVRDESRCSAALACSAVFLMAPPACWKKIRRSRTSELHGSLSKIPQSVQEFFFFRSHFLHPRLLPVQDSFLLLPPPLSLSLPLRLPVSDPTELPNTPATGLTCRRPAQSPTPPLGATPRAAATFYFKRRPNKSHVTWGFLRRPECAHC